MSYDITLKCDHCGNEEEFNITYNFAKHYYKHIDEKDGIRKIYGMTGKESLKYLEYAYFNMKGSFTGCYEGTEGNARAALRPLIEAAIDSPGNRWDGD